MPRTKKEQQFITTVKRYYKRAGRHDLPWRQTSDPYKIAVSEVMLQQTQVARVIEKYKLFLKSFPTVESLAQARLADVLRAWSGLGYNRRAKFLKQMAEEIMTEHNGRFPKTLEGLRQLPGVGSYTAGAIYAFAYDKPAVFIETNIRSVYIHHFFSDKYNISDITLVPIIERTLNRKNPREWYWALMDYGAHLKEAGNTAHRASKHYVKQSTFKGSDREVRGTFLKLLLKKSGTKRILFSKCSFEREKMERVLAQLVSEGLVSKKGLKYQIST